VLLTAIAMVCAVASAVPASADAAFPGGSGKIVFAAASAGTTDYSIWVMDADGTDRTQLTNFGPGTDFSPRWSPDGTKIAFSRRLDADGETYVWTMDADGSNATSRSLGSAPAWSPDGTKIAFGFVVDPGFDFDVWTMDADGSDRTQLSHHHDAMAPAWSPDGSRSLCPRRPWRPQRLPLDHRAGRDR
jgi:Tol biopolymer transport system component